MTTGIVLAAGDATRMPNKLMLHTPRRQPLVYDAIEYCMKQCSYVVVVTKKDSIVESYLRGLRYKLDIRFQTRPTGVVDAISIGGSKDILVAFGDCYGYERLVPVLSNSATVVAGHEEVGLDGHNGKKWMKRTSVRITHSFVGAFRCDHWSPKTDDLMAEFNAHGIKPQVVNTYIKDCGTPEGYLDLWQR
jgi:hypothetical protein